MGEAGEGGGRRGMGRRRRMLKWSKMIFFFCWGGVGRGVKRDYFEEFCKNNFQSGKKKQNQQQKKTAKKSNSNNSEKKKAAKLIQLS